MEDFVLEKEIEWRSVVEFENYYEVSNIGRCRSVTRSIVYNNDIKSRNGIWNGKILKPTLRDDGYLRYNLSIDGKTYRIFAHRMVAKAFIPNPENKRVVNHIDSNRSNNNVENLEWATDSENQKHYYKYGNRKAKFYGYCCVDKGIQLTKLVSLKDFVLNFEPTREQIIKYAKFLNKTLELGYFIPTDECGNVIKQGTNTCQYDFEVEQQAKERVLFVYKPNFDLSAIKHQISQGKNIEYLANHCSIELTQSAIKQLGL